MADSSFARANVLKKLTWISWFWSCDWDLTISARSFHFFVSSNSFRFPLLLSFPKKCDLGRWASNLISTKDSFWETFENGFHFIAGQSILDSFSTPSQTRIQFLRFWIKILDEGRVISPGTFLTRITQDIFFPKGRKFITKKSPESVKA